MCLLSEASQAKPTKQFCLTSILVTLRFDLIEMFIIRCKCNSLNLPVLKVEPSISTVGVPFEYDQCFKEREEEVSRT